MALKGKRQRQKRKHDDINKNTTANSKLARVREQSVAVFQCQGGQRCADDRTEQDEQYKLNVVGTLHVCYEPHFAI